MFTFISEPSSKSKARDVCLSNDTSLPNFFSASENRLALVQTRRFLPPTPNEPRPGYCRKFIRKCRSYPPLVEDRYCNLPKICCKTKGGGQFCTPSGGVALTDGQNNNNNHNTAEGSTINDEEDGNDNDQELIAFLSAENEKLEFAASSKNTFKWESGENFIHKNSTDESLYFNYAAGYPQANTTKRCLGMQSKGLWINVDCKTLAKGVLCETKSSKKLYKAYLNEKATTQTKAQQFCAKQFPGGQLASIKTNQELARITKVIASTCKNICKKTVKKFWISAKANSKYSFSFEWGDGLVMNYYGQPVGVLRNLIGTNGACVAINSQTNQWVRVDCDGKFFPVCEYPGEEEETPSPISSSLSFRLQPQATTKRPTTQKPTTPYPTSKSPTSKATKSPILPPSTSRPTFPMERLCYFKCGLNMIEDNYCDEDCRTPGCYMDKDKCGICASNCDYTKQFNNVCDDSCYSTGGSQEDNLCAFDTPDCRNRYKAQFGKDICNSKCKNDYVGDDVCDPEICGYQCDQIDCVPSTFPPNCQCSLELLQNTVCDQTCDTPECNCDNFKCRTAGTCNN